MNYKKTTKSQKFLPYDRLKFALFLLVLHVSYVSADNSAISNLISISNLNVWVDDNAITNINFSSLSENIVQIELDLIEPIDATTPFQTNNPARISLDFVGVHSNLKKKKFSVNQGAVKAVYIAEASKKTRVIINLMKPVLYEIKTIANKVFVIVNSSNTDAR